MLVARVNAQTGPGGVGTAANNVLWLSADAGVNTTGAAVNSWNDRSGNNNHAAYQAGQPAQRPSLVASSQNGYPSIDFDGVDDELLVNDAASLDLNGWDFFLVNAVDAAKNNNAWFTKSTSTTCNYGWWSTSTNAMQMPIYDIFTLFNAPSTVANVTGAAFTLEQYTNNVFFGLFPSRTVYRNGVSIYTDLNLLQLPQHNNQPLRIGNAAGATGWNLDGDIAELVLFNSRVNSAQRVIISNYLAAKYGLVLGANEVYRMDNAASGDYDHEVAGIGRIDAGNQHTSARGSSIVHIHSPSNLGNNEFLMWGHNNDILGTWGSVDLPAGIQGRWFRVWRVSELSPTGAVVDVGSVTMDFDLNAFSPIVAADIRLLVDTDNDGVFADETPIGPPTAIGGGIYRFSGITQLADQRRFTLGTLNTTSTPLPVELIAFEAEAHDPEGIALTWSTATERNNAQFDILRSTDAASWQVLARVEGAGDSQEQHDYLWWDTRPVTGINYYRLRQTDHDGNATDLPVRTAWWSTGAGPVVFPNPTDGAVEVLVRDDTPVVVVVLDPLGRVVLQRTAPGAGRLGMDLGGLRDGTYTLRCVQGERMSVLRVVLQR
ncbi:MAG: T9SS type A sorting domain-containing protein [Flavobacteriales bacterium]|nr:T9SS type A sorting domain-containing protein [Flavobacteriales bacterium]